MDKKKVAVTFIPFIVWFIAIFLFFYYSEILVRTSFPVWAFTVVTLPVCMGSMAICYAIVVSREVDGESVWKLDKKEDETGGKETK